MFQHQFDQLPSRRIAFHWFLLSFNAGLINAGGFLATGRFVSHVTGFATLFGVDMAVEEYKAAVRILSVPLFFLVGAFMAGLLIDFPLSRNKKPHFDWVMGVSGFCLLLVSVLGIFSYWGEFGNEETKLKQIYFMLTLICMACGLQNAAISFSSNRSVRITHMTGLTTDIGLGLAKLFSIGHLQDKFSREVRLVQVRVGSVLSFVIGSGIGAYLFVQTHYYGFLAASFITFYGAWHGRNAKKRFQF